MIANESLASIKNKDANKTYDKSTDSLEAIADAVGGISGDATEAKQDIIIANTDNIPASPAPSGEYDTELDVNMSTRAPAAEYNTEMARITADVATEAKQDTIDTNIDTLITRLSSMVNKTTFWSDVDDLALLTSTAADLALPSITLPNITGTIVRVYGGMVIAKVKDTSSAPNGVNVAQKIRVKKSTGAWDVDDLDIINVVDNSLYCDADETRGGVAWIGNYDVAAEVDAFNAVYNVQWEDADVDGDSLELYDIQTFLVVEWY